MRAVVKFAGRILFACGAFWLSTFGLTDNQNKWRGL